jgi:hypothetical protein
MTGISVLILACVLAALFFWIWRTRSPKVREGGLYRTLVRQAGGDTAVADRLIEHELRRRPNLARDEAIQSAIWRLDRDRR